MRRFIVGLVNALLLPASTASVSQSEPVQLFDQLAHADKTLFTAFNECHHAQAAQYIAEDPIDSTRKPLVNRKSSSSSLNSSTSGTNKATTGWLPAHSASTIGHQNRPRPLGECLNLLSSHRTLCAARRLAAIRTPHGTAALLQQVKSAVACHT